jgi:GTP-binding protein HflX
LNRTDGVVSEAAILVGVVLPDDPQMDDPLEELQGLAETAGARVVGRLTQRRETPDMTTYLGRGKVEELNALAAAKDAEVVLFDNDLNPGQKRNLEKELKIKVLDRSELILDIFANRARTHEARLAVELAQLQYALPRLKQMWSHLSRIKKGIGMRGPGEKQLEEDRRIVERRIRDLRQELAVVERRREQQVSSRRQHMKVSLIGYTNAGKSTLLNALTGSDIYAANKLFATLDTRTRRWELPSWGPVLLSDTVGFIRKLPHHLIASFRATLEEARQADLLLHVADASSPQVVEQIAAVYSVLEELGIEEKRTVLVLNKLDALPDDAPRQRLLGRYPNAVCTSARRRLGLHELACKVSDTLSGEFSDVDIETGVENGRVLAYLAAHGEILSQRYHDSRVVVHCRIPEHYLARLDRTTANVRPHRNGSNGNGGNGNGSATANPLPAAAER